MMYSYAAMKAVEDKEETKAEQRGEKNDKGTKRADSTKPKE